MGYKDSRHYRPALPSFTVPRDIKPTFVYASIAFYKTLTAMETQRNGNNLSSLGEDDLDVRNSGHSADKTANNRVLPFSIEAILSAPHPKKHSSVTRKMPRWSSQGTSTESPPAILTLEDFTSSNLPNDRSEEPETAEIGEI